LIGTFQLDFTRLRLQLAPVAACPHVAPSFGSFIPAGIAPALRFGIEHGAPHSLECD
jgi:hypothetical protein